MGNVKDVVNKEYVSSYKKKCDISFIIYVCIAVIVQIIVGIGIYYFNGSFNVIYILLLGVILYNSIKTLKVTIYSKHLALLEQLDKEYDKIDNIDKSNVYSLFSQTGEIKVMFRCEDKEYCLAVEDYAVVIEEMVKGDSAIL